MSTTRRSAYVKVQTLLIQLKYDMSRHTAYLEDVILDYEDEINLMVVNAFTQSDVEDMSVFLFIVNDPQSGKERYVLISSYDGNEGVAHDAALEQLNTDGRKDEYEYFMDVIRIRGIVVGHDTHETLV